MLMDWGQFLAHDLTGTPVGKSATCLGREGGDHVFLLEALSSRSSLFPRFLLLELAMFPMLCGPEALCSQAFRCWSWLCAHSPDVILCG